MSVTAAPVVADDGAPDVARRDDRSFVESLVARLHAEYGGDPQVIRRHVAAVLDRFAGARITAFVPILVEKQVRQRYRRRGEPLPALPG
jgi:hypothetical protein